MDFVSKLRNEMYRVWILLWFLFVTFVNDKSMGSVMDYVLVWILHGYCCHISIIHSKIHTF